MEKINENIINLYNKWKNGYTRKENSFELRVKDFLSNKGYVNKYKISEDGKHLNVFGDVYIFNNDIHDGKLPVPFGKVDSFFNCSDCRNLTSLEGAPKKVGDGFNCNGCYSLTSLEGAPESVDGFFDCSWCDNIASLVGAPENVGGSFYCNRCDNLTSLKGAPKEVGVNFHCDGCPKLESIEDLPKIIGNDLCIDERFKGKIPDDVIVKGEIEYV